MKKSILFFAFILFAISINAQVIKSNGNLSYLKSKAENLNKGMQKINHKKYLTADYRPTRVNKENKVHFLRFNIFENEMEFIKDNERFYLDKNTNTHISFTNDNENYKIFKLNNKPHYFKIILEGENSILLNQIVAFKEGKKAKSSYDKATPPNFIRKKDEILIAFSNKNLMIVPKNKKKFYSLFGENSNKIKKYVKDNKLKFKKLKDLKEIIIFYNSL